MPPLLNKYHLAKGWLGINFVCSLAIFALTVFFPSFVTQIPNVTASNWTGLFLIRLGIFFIPLLWFLSSAGFYLASFLAEKKKFLWTFFGASAAIIITIFFNYRFILDLSSGPLAIRGKITEARITRIENAFFYHYIESRVIFESEKKIYFFKNKGNRAVAWEELINQIEINKTVIDLTVLPKSGFVIK